MIDVRSSASTSLAYRTLTPAACATVRASRVRSAKRASIAALSLTRTSERADDVRGIPSYIVIGKDGLILSKGHDWEEAAATALKAAK